MANTIELASVFQKNLDEQMTAKLTSGWMEANAGQVNYTGGKEIKIPHMELQGLADYSRNDGAGYVNGDVTFSYQTKTMRKDRGRSFHLDINDEDETDFALQATGLLIKFQRDKVVPEVDAYRYSMLAQEMLIANADKGGNVKGITSGTGKGTGVAKGIVTGNYTPDKATIYSKLKADLAAIRDVVGDIPLVITMTSLNLSLLEQADEITRQLNVADFPRGDIMTRVKTFDGIPIVEVPSSRMKTEFDFKANGAGGFEKTSVALDINWMITPLAAPIAVCKTDLPRIFSPSVNQQASAWKIDYRKYHDIWITNEQLKLCRLNVAGAITRVTAKSKEEAAE